MKVSIKQLGTGSFATLFDEAVAGTVLVQFLPRFAAKVAEFDMFDQDKRRRLPTKNAQGSLALTFRSQYADTGTAMDSFLTSCGYLTQTSVIKVEQGSKTHYYGNATCGDYAVAEWTGVAVSHSFMFQTDVPSATNPET